MKKIKIGIFGGGVRGLDLAKNFLLLNCDIVAVCEFRTERKEEIIKNLGNAVAIYEDFDSFIEHDMDAVVLQTIFMNTHPMQ